MRFSIAFLCMLTAAAVATTAVFHATQQAQINYFQGHDRFTQGDYAGAIPFLVKAVFEKPQYKEAMTELAYAYLWSGNSEQSLGIFQQLLQLDPHSIKNKKAMADAYSWSKQYAKAEEFYLQVLAANNRDVETQKKLAEVYTWDQQYEKAKRILEMLLKVQPNDIRAKFLYAKALQYSGRTQEAVRIYQELLNEKSPASEEHS